MKEVIIKYFGDKIESHEIVEEVGELIRCKDCIKKPICTIYRETNDEYGYCSLSEHVRKENRQ